MMLVDGAIDSYRYFLFRHAIQQDGCADRYQQCSTVRDERCRILNYLHIVLIIIDVESVIEFFEDFDGACVR